MPESVQIEFGQVGALHEIALPRIAEARDVHAADELAYARMFGLQRRVALLRVRDFRIGAVAGRLRPPDALAFLDLPVLGLHARPPLHPHHVQRAHQSHGEQNLREDHHHRPHDAPFAPHLRKAVNPSILPCGCVTTPAAVFHVASSGSCISVFRKSV